MTRAVTTAGDTRAALRAMGVMERPTPGPTEPRKVRRKQKIEEARACEKTFKEELEFRI